MNMLPSLIQSDLVHKSLQTKLPFHCPIAITYFSNHIKLIAMRNVNVRNGCLEVQNMKKHTFIEIYAACTSLSHVCGEDTTMNKKTQTLIT